MKKQSFSSPEKVITGDGSSSLIHAHLDEMYHSRHGAWTETNYIFIGKGLDLVTGQSSGDIFVFEMGFGSGLNAVCTMETAIEANVRIHYTTIEQYPVDPDVIREMKFPFPDENSANRLLGLHEAPWNTEVIVNDQFTLHKIAGKFPDDIHIESGRYDIIYYDAFAPGAQPELWDLEIMELCFSMLKPGGIWITFSSKSSVRRHLIQAGFDVEKLPGPPGKREILRAVKPDEMIQGEN